MKMNTKMIRSRYIEGALSLLFFIAFLGDISCSNGNSSNLDVSKDSLRNSIVQVFESETFITTGVVVENGSKVAAVLNYESDLPTALRIITYSGQQFEASLQVTDFRTGLSLLDIGNGRLPCPTTGDAPSVKLDQDLFVYGWRQHEESENQSTVSGEIQLQKVTAIVINAAQGSPTECRINAGSKVGLPVSGYIQPGDIVADRDRSVLGLVGHLYWGLIPPPLYAGYIPPVIGINSVHDLLTSGTSKPIWTSGGPTAFALVGSNYSKAYTTVPSNYNDVSIEIQGLLSSVGGAVAFEDLTTEFSSFPFAPKYGRMLVAVYPELVSLQGSQGIVLAQANWIGIWLGAPGKHDCVFYGTEQYDVEGALEILSDTSELASLFSP